MNSEHARKFGWWPGDLELDEENSEAGREGPPAEKPRWPDGLGKPPEGVDVEIVEKP